MIFNNVKIYLNNQPFIASVIVFFCVFLFFLFLYMNSSGDPMRDDHYFHFRYAYLLRMEGLDVVTNFDWICANPVGCDGFRYPVNLFQIFIIPFTYLPDELMALHSVDAFFASIAIAIFYYTLRKACVRYSLFFALSLFVSSYFISRILWGRAFVLPTTLVFLEMYFAIEKKYKILFGLFIFHILWHQNTYFMPIMIMGIVECARYLVYQKIYIKNIIATISAVIVAMAFFPGFPRSLILWMGNIFAIQSNAVMSEDIQSIEGVELITKDFMTTFVNEKILLLLLIFCSTITVFLYIQQKNRAQNLFKNVKKNNVVWVYTLFIFTLIMFLGTIAVSGRFFDFLIPSIFVFSAFVVTLLTSCRKIIIDKILRNFFVAGAIIYVSILSMNTIIDIYAQAHKFDYEPAQKAATWIEYHSQNREKVFLLNWSEFPLMFFSNYNNIYSTGTEPMALKQYDESLYWKYYNMFNYHYYCEKQGDCREEIEKQKKQINGDEEKSKMLEKENGRMIIESIKNDFGAKFIVSSTKSFTRAMELHPELIEDKFYVKSDKYSGHSMEFTVFELK